MAIRTVRIENIQVFWYTNEPGTGGPEQHSAVILDEFVTFTGNAGTVKEHPGQAGSSYWTFNGERLWDLPYKPGGFGIIDTEALARMADEG
jgi:hypothetical protein